MKLKVDSVASALLELKQFIYLDPLLSRSANLCFYGGSFNPWHDGHTECLRLASLEGPVVVIPDHNPQKHGDCSNSNFTNLMGIKSTCEEFKNVRVYEGFYSLNQANPTVDWFCALKKLLPERELGLLVGFDSFKGLSTWKDYQKLLFNLDFLHVVGRGESEEERRRYSQWLLAGFSDLNLKLLGGHEFEHVSSTQLREELVSL